MQRVLLAMCVVLLATMSAMAQETPKAEFSAGYTYGRIDGGITYINMNVWNASLVGNVNHWFGIAGEIGGLYRSDFNLHSFLFGPRLSARNTVTAFSHMLFGGVRAGNGGSETAFGAAIGGGVDVPFRDALALRLIQFDYLFTRFGGTTQNNMRLSFGIVFRLGSK